jgi:hypothetical protein
MRKEELINKIEKLIAESEVSEAEKIDLLNLFFQADEKQLGLYLNLFEENINNAKIVSDVYQEKKEAFETKDKKNWEYILEQECKNLERIEEN